MTIAFYNFGGSGGDEWHGQNRRLITAGSWQRWAAQTLRELPDNINRVWLHNPFGLWSKPGDDDRLMWIDQWQMSRDALPKHLTDDDDFAEACDILRWGGVEEIVAYVGGVQTIPTPTYREAERCLRPYLRGGCSIGLDATFDWRQGDEIDAIIQAIRSQGHKVYCEPWPLAGREYGEIDGWAMNDRFVDNQVAKGFVRDGDLADSFDAEQVVIQREWDAQRLSELDATLAVRLWTDTGRELAG